MRIPILALALATALTGLAAAADPAPAPPRRQTLGPVARSVLKKRMARHGKDMEALLAAALALDFDELVAVGTRIADEPRLVRPGPSSDTANALFPETFFVFQDALRDDAARVVEAAKARNDDALAQRFGHLTATCVGCHALYMRAR